MIQSFKAKACLFNVLKEASDSFENVPYPYFRSSNGDKEIFCISPLHGRSFVMADKRRGGRYVVSKGNGLGYSEFGLLNTGEFGNDTWGLLLRQDAMRDFIVGNEIRKLGIRTNRMEYVLELQNEIIIPRTGISLKPVLLQYSLECPFRINDAPFMERVQIESEVRKWKQYDDKGYHSPYMIAAKVLIGNLRTMQDLGILHNAIHAGNYTWALELLDFELSHTPAYPYSNEDYIRHVPDLMPREALQTYEIIIYIAGCLHERPDYGWIDSLFNDYGYDLDKFRVNQVI